MTESTARMEPEDEKAAGPAERILHGIGISRGIAIGRAWPVEVTQPQAPEYAVAAGETQAEIERFHRATDQARRQLFRLKGKSAELPESAAEEINYLLDAHLAMLTGSRLIRGVEKRIREQLVNAEHAVVLEVDSLAEQFAALEDEYIRARIDDVREAGARLIRNLMGAGYNELAHVPENGIVFAEEITPADTAMMDPKKLAGFASVLGGPAGHTAVMARSLGLPAVVGVSGLLESVHNETLVIVDGIDGRIVINPSPATLEEYRRRQDGLAEENEQLKGLRDIPARTTEGVHITLQANLDLPAEVGAVRDCGAEGIGLFRTEFMFMNRRDLPDEEEQFAAMAGVVKAMGGRPVTLRTLDIGGEKMSNALSGHLTSSANPALGLRAIRLSLKEPYLLETQFAAMLRAAAYGPVRVLLPMVTRPDEMRQARSIYLRVAAELKERGIDVPDQLPPLGAMIEIPAAALSADSLATVSDFFAIGTNDLIQYTIAIDRSNEQVAHMYNPLNPAVLRLIHFTVEAARRAGIPVSLCGEMAANPDYTALLAGLGVQDFSVGPGSLPLIKQRICGISMAAAADHARRVMDRNDAAGITALLDEFNHGK